MTLIRRFTSYYSEYVPKAGFLTAAYYLIPVYQRTLDPLPILYFGTITKRMRLAIVDISKMRIFPWQQKKSDTLNL
jgi:hypothetical protein